MYAICSTKKNDVRDAVRDMKKSGRWGDIYQLSKVDYNALEADNSKIPEKVASLSCNHVVNVLKGTLHKQGCKKALDTSAQAARIVRISEAGLKLCKICMKK